MPERLESTMRMPPRISLFPKCYFDELVDGRRSLEQWIRDAATLGGEGVEHYDGWFRSYEPKDVDPIVADHGGDRPDHLDDLLLARLHPPRQRRTQAAGRAAEGARSI